MPRFANAVPMAALRSAAPRRGVEAAELRACATCEWCGEQRRGLVVGFGHPSEVSAAERLELTSSAAAANFNLRLFLAHACFAARVMAVLLEWPCRPTDWRRWVDVRDTWNAAAR